ncbi:MAG: sulfur reduction protein DsrE [Nitrospirae bacterium]|nr:MAG: sulfur reduction protein DsrE [Nitrospirota bacterium]
MAKFLFVITRGLEDPVRVTRALFLAKVAKEGGHEVDVFLTDDAVIIAKPGMVDNVMTPTGDEAASHLGYLEANGVVLHVCTPCAQSRQIKEDELIENARFATGPELIEMATKATVFTF